jgi:hypothetical protein
VEIFLPLLYDLGIKFYLFWSSKRTKLVSPDVVNTFLVFLLDVTPKNGHFSAVSQQKRLKISQNAYLAIKEISASRNDHF